MQNQAWVASERICGNFLFTIIVIIIILVIFLFKSECRMLNDVCQKNDEEGSVFLAGYSVLRNSSQSS